MTRGFKNARHIKSIAPHIFETAGTRGVTSLIPPKTLAKLQTLARPQDHIDNKQLGSLLEKKKLPSPRKTVYGSLFNGTLYFAQLTFNTSNGPIVMGDNDVQTALDYTKLAIVPIQQYSSQYGPNSISLSGNIISYPVNLTDSSSGFADTDLQNWVSDIAKQKNLPPNGSSCIIILNAVDGGVMNQDANPNQVGGYHSLTAGGIPYCYCNVFGQNLTVDDTKNVFAEILSHEIAEMTVDPLANLQNPEVCDPCAGNCGNVWNEFFDQDGNYIDGSQKVPPGFDYGFFINSLIRPASYDPNTQCAIQGTDPRMACVYSPPPIQQ